MRIERVDDKTVKCFLSNEELEEYDIDYKDFIMRNDKAKQLVHDIITLAAEQVGYKPPKFAFDMQIMMLPDQGLLLTFSESEHINNSGANQILEYLREMRQTIQRTKEQLGITDEPINPENNNNASGSQEIKSEKAVFEFDSIARIMSYASVLPSNLRVHSSLYKQGDKYYLYLQKKNASYERFSRACIQALEFSSLYGADDKLLSSFKEHGECLIAKKALQKLNINKKQKTPQE